MRKLARFLVWLLALALSPAVVHAEGPRGGAAPEGRTDARAVDGRRTGGRVAKHARWSRARAADSIIAVRPDGLTAERSDGLVSYSSAPWRPRIPRSSSRRATCARITPRSSARFSKCFWERRHREFKAMAAEPRAPEAPELARRAAAMRQRMSKHQAGRRLASASYNSRRARTNGDNSAGSTSGTGRGRRGCSHRQVESARENGLDGLPGRRGRPPLPESTSLRPARLPRRCDVSSRAASWRLWDFR